MPVNTLHPDYESHSPRWTKCRDAIAGEDAIKSKTVTYLPALGSHKQGSATSSGAYENYLARAMFYGAAKRTTFGLAGSVMRKPPILSGVPDGIAKALTEQVGRSKSLHVIAAELVESLVGVGRHCLLVDRTADPTDLTSAPYVVQFDAECVINWRQREGGACPTPSLIVIETMVDEPSPTDPFAMVESNRWLVFRLDEQGEYVREEWRDTKGVAGAATAYVLRSSSKPTKKGGRPWTEIPCVVVNATTGVALDPESPPILDMVNVNLHHYMSSADLSFGEHMCAIPQPWVKCFNIPEGTSLVAGSGVAWVADDSNAQAAYLEFSGAGLGRIAEGMHDKEKLMATLGARLLESQAPANEAFGTVRLRQSGERSVLAKIADNASTGMTQVLRWLLQWESAEFDAPDGKVAEVSYTLSTDFDSEVMDPAKLVALVEALQKGTISWETFSWNMRRGEMLPPGVTDQEERDRIQMGAPGPARRQDIAVLQADVQAGRIDVRTYLESAQALGLYQGIDIDAMLAALADERAMADQSRMDAMARMMQTPESEPEPAAVGGGKAA